MKEFERAPQFDQPELTTKTVVGKDFGPSIPQQLGFTNEAGAEIQMSVERAIELGLVTREEVRYKSADITHYGLKKVDEYFEA